MTNLEILVLSLLLLWILIGTFQHAEFSQVVFFSLSTPCVWLNNCWRIVGFPKERTFHCTFGKSTLPIDLSREIL